MNSIRVLPMEVANKIATPIIIARLISPPINIAVDPLCGVSTHPSHLAASAPSRNVIANIVFIFLPSH